MSTDKILKKILNINDVAEYYEYETWDKTKNIINIYKGVYLDKINYILCVKEKNYGKRDSLVLVRKLCYNYNYVKFDKLEDELKKSIYNTFKNIEV
jgi:hypothetical protein